MPRAKKRFYEIAPGWPGGADAVVDVDGWCDGLTTSMTFEALEAYDGKKLAAGGTLRTKPRTIPDLIHVVGYTPIVTSTFKSVLETHAPGEAEFRIFALRWKDGTPVPGTRYYCNILNRIDCLDLAIVGKKRPEAPTVSPSGKPLTPEESWHREGSTDFIVFGADYIDPDMVGNFHIWRPRWQALNIFVTSKLLKALKDAGVKGLRTRRLSTRDDP